MGASYSELAARRIVTTTLSVSTSIYDIEVETLEGKNTTLEPYRGQVMLIVNTASQCGLTPQFEGLEKLHSDLGDRGLAVLGFPCNQFGKQEPGSAAEIGAFCQKNYGVSFPMHAKIEVNGKGKHPLYAHLRKEQGGMLGSQIKWNFTKFLVNRDGEVIDRFAPTTKPGDLVSKIEKLL